MFVAFGAGAAWFGGVLLENRRTLEIAAGIFIALAGLVYARVPLPRLLLAERRLHPRSGSGGGVVTPTLAGVAFAVGWTPCVGPTLAAILALAASDGHPGQGAVLLAVYALGLGIPFLLFGLLFTRSLGLVRAFRRHWRVVSLASGSLLVAFGVLLATGELVRLTTRLAPAGPIGSHIAGRDAPERVAGGRSDDGKVEVADQQDQRAIHQAVVEQDRAGEAESGVALAVPEKEARDGKKQREGCGQRCVELLAGVEPARTAATMEKPASVVLVEAIELAQGRERPPPVTDSDDKRERDQPRDAGIEVECLDERPARDEHAQLWKVEDEPRSEQGKEAEREHPVQRPLCAGEPADDAAFEPSRAHSSVRPRRPGRSRVSPKSP